MAHRLLRRGLTYFARYAVPKDRWQDVGLVLRAANGERREVVRSLQTRDFREAERRRDGAIADIIAELDRRLERAGKRPLTDWTADWTERAGLRRATLQAARTYPTRAEREDYDGDVDTPHDMAMDDIRADCETLLDTRGLDTANAYHAAATGTAAIVGETSDAWLADEERHGTPKARLVAHRTVLDLLARFMSEQPGTPKTLKAVPFDRITPRIANAFVEWRAAMPSQKRAGRTISAAAINRELATLRAVWKFARRREDTTLDPWRDVAPKLPREVPDEDKKRAYSTAELLALFDAPAAAWAPNGGGYGQAMQDAAALALLTGMRLDELMGLELRDVEGGCEDPTALVVRSGKTANASRVVPLCAMARTVLQARLRGLPGGAPGAASLWPEVPPAAPARLLSTRFPKVRRRIFAAAGLPDTGHAVDFHSFRRSFATFGHHTINSTAAGGAMTDHLLAALSGHKERTMVLRVYGPRVAREHLDAAIDAWQRHGLPGEVLAALQRNWRPLPDSQKPAEAPTGSLESCPT